MIMQQNHAHFSPFALIQHHYRQINMQTSPIRQRCVLTVSLGVLTLALDMDGQTDEAKVSNEALKIS